MSNFFDIVYGIIVSKLTKEILSMANKINESDKISKRICALCILRILEDYTYKNPVTGEIQSIKIQHEEEPKGIQQRLEEVYKLKVDRGTIKTALADLTTFGIEICEHEPETRKKGNGKAYGYYLNKSALLDAGEYTFITSLISDASFMTEAQKTAIQSKIDKVSSNEYGKTIGLLPKETKYDIFKSDAVLKHFDNVKSAISTRSKISFTSNKYGIDKQLHPDKTEIKFSPYHIVNSKGKFYIIGKKDGDYSLTHYRMDMISDISLLRESFTPDGTNVQRYIDSHPFMSNEKRTVNRCVMNVKIDSIGAIIDEFGLGIDIRNEVKGEKIQDGYCRITLSNVIEEDVCKWALMHADITEVLEPQDLRYYIQNTANFIRRTYSKNEEDKKLRVMDIGVRGDCLQIGHYFNPSIKDSKDFDGMMLSEKIELIKRIYIRKSVKTEFLHLDKYINTTELQIVDTPISSIDFVKDYKKLRRVVLAKTEVNDLRPLINCTKLESIVLTDNKLTNYAAIYMLKSLKHLGLDEATAMKIEIERIKKNNPDIVIECRKAGKIVRI